MDEAAPTFYRLYHDMMRDSGKLVFVDGRKYLARGLDVWNLETSSCPEDRLYLRYGVFEIFTRRKVFQ